jgi:hypothetical protein
MILVKKKPFLKDIKIKRMCDVCRELAMGCPWQQ